MRHDHHIGAPGQTTRGERTLGCTFDVTGEQEHLSAGHDAQDAGTVVVPPALARLRMQELELDTFPAPGFACEAWRGRHPRQRHGTSMPYRRDVHATHDRSGTSRMIHVGVAQHQQIDAVHATCAQERQNSRIACGASAAKRRTGVVQQHMAVRAHDHGQTLSDIEHVHERLSLRRHGARRKRDRQNHRQSEQAPAQWQRYERHRCSGCQTRGRNR